MLTKIAISGIGLYQKYLSPFTGRSCRFYPSCSHYSVQSLQKYGLVKGVRLIVVRLAKCHPFHPGGYDPVI
ncbi:MAG: membrane protein insertion efficiency factor YidD [Geobacteraceae bacterium]|nr:membrane protein insertion efficiency factor YidD [Geobacteraceae bacterium]